MDWKGLLQVEVSSIFKVTWTEDIMAETLYHLLKKHRKWSEQQVVVSAGTLRKLLPQTDRPRRPTLPLNTGQHAAPNMSG
jgi:hypothetical protein